MIFGWIVLVLAAIGVLVYLYEWFVEKPRKRRERLQRGREL